MECEPGARVEVVSAALPLLRVPVPIDALPSLNVTVPVAALGVTVAVKVTELKKVEGLGLEVRLVDVDVVARRLPGVRVTRNKRATERSTLLENLNGFGMAGLLAKGVSTNVTGRPGSCPS